MCAAKHAPTLTFITLISTLTCTLTLTLTLTLTQNWIFKIHTMQALVVLHHLCRLAVYNAKFCVSCLRLVCPTGVVVFLRCLVPILFCFTANSLLDGNGHGLVGYGFEKSSFWLRLE